MCHSVTRISQSNAERGLNVALGPGIAARMKASKLAIVALSALAVVSCGDDLLGTNPDAVVSQTVPAPASTTAAFTFAREVEVDWTTQFSGVRVVTPDLDASFAGVQRIEVRVVGGGVSETLVDMYDFVSTATSRNATVSPVFRVQDVTGFGAQDDFDGDFEPNATDNCPQVRNTTQEDADADGVGDACDSQPDDPTVGVGSPDAGMPPMELRFRVFADPATYPSDGVRFEIEMRGSGLIDVRL